MSMFFMESVMYQKHLADVIVFFTKDDQLIHAKWSPWCQTKMRWGYCYIVDMCVCLYCPYLLYYYKLITDTMFVTGPLSPQLLRHCIRWPDVASGDGDHGQVCCWSQGGAGPGPCYQQHHFLIFYQLVSQLSHNNLSPVMITQLKIFSKTLTVQLILILWNAL